MDPRETFILMLGTAALFAALTLPGLILGKSAAGRTAPGELGAVLRFIAMPALVFSNLRELCGSPVTGAGLAAAALIPAILDTGLFFITALVFPKSSDPLSRRAARVSAIFANCGFFGLPLAGAVFPDQPQIRLYVAVFNVVSTVIYLTLGCFMMTGERGAKRFIRVVLRAPVIWAATAAVIWSFSGLDKSVPFAGEIADMLASVCTPLAMIGLGLGLAGIKRDSLKGGTGDLARVSLIRLLLSPVLTLALSLPLKDPGFSTAMLIASGVASAGSIPALFRQYGADGSRAALFTFGTTVLSVATLPLLYRAASALSAVI